MALLLDTQILIWLEENLEKIPLHTRSVIFSNPDVYFSVANIWKMAIKIKIGKLQMKFPLPDMVSIFILGYKFKLLDIERSHIYQTLQMPLHHRDPFDRLIIAQSIVENIDVVSSDEAFDAYGINRIW